LPLEVGLTSSNTSST